MSEINELTQEFEKLLKQKPILKIEIMQLEGEKNSLKSELEDIQRNIDHILADIETKKAKAMEEVRIFSDKQKRTIGDEIVRMESQRKEDEERREQLKLQATVQNRKENELNALSNNVTEERHLVVEMQAKISIEQSILDKKDQEVTLNLSKIESLVKEAKRILTDQENIKRGNQDVERANAIKAKELKNERSTLDIKEEKLNERSEILLNEANHLEIQKDKQNKREIAQEEKQRSLDKYKKDLNDQENSLKADKVNLAMERAKFNVSKQKSS